MTAETPETGAENTLEQELAAAREEIVSLVAERDAERDRALRMAAEAEKLLGYHKRDGEADASR